MATTKIKTGGIKDLNVTVEKLPAAVDISGKTVTLPATVGGLGTGIDAATQLNNKVATANLGTGTASSTTILYGDQTYKTEPAEYDDDAVVNDIATLALHQATDSNASKYNLVNTNVDQFEDSTGVASFTDCARNADGEYVSTGIEGSATYTTYTTGSGDFTVPAGVTSVEALVVAGGGGGGGSDGSGQTAGGGGGGGVVHHATLATTPAATIAYAVGTGGAGGNNYNPDKDGTNGVNSTFGSITAVGGGGGASGSPGLDGGSGGGTGRGGATAGSGTQGDSGGGTGYGNDGSNTGPGSGVGCSGAGGGAGGAATAATGSSDGGDGGAGQLFSNFTSYGESGYFGGGGGGGGSSSPGTGGSGGGGDPSGGAGTANTGGGGGGVNTTGYGGAGGTGFIGLLYTPVTMTATGNFVSTATTANAAVTSMGGVITYTNTSGTNTLNTDIVLEVSADSGSNYSTATLVAAGTFSTGILQAVANDIAVTSGTGIQYRISFANQSSGSKEARINGVSLMY